MVVILRSRGVSDVSVIRNVEFQPMVGDPDDHRPNTSWALIFDPPRPDGPYVRDLTCIIERIAPGDAIPLHTHEIDEVVMIDNGNGTYRLGEEEVPIEGGGVAFIPAGTPHGLRNDGDGALALKAVFASSTLDITYLERNPAPGTQGDAPQPPTRFDPRVGMP
jgi:mannose-6-phosphate isomerase-like protein (cupin superfamily)